MVVYWSMFLLPAMLALQQVRLRPNVWPLIGAVLIVLIGLRYEVGGDWGSYRNQVVTHGNMLVGDILAQGREPAYRLLNWLAYQTGGGLWLVNLICAAIFATGLISFVKRLPDPLLALTVAMPYLVIVVAMGYTRQATAIGLILFGLKYFNAGRAVPFVALVFLAALFHRTSLLFLGVALLPIIQRQPAAAVLLVPVAYGMYLLVLAEEADRLIHGYIHSDYATKSAGGVIRVALSACFAVLFLAFRHRFAMTRPEGQLWLWIAVVSIALVPLAASYPTAVDRMALFFLPLQVFVAGHIAVAFGGRAGSAVRLLTVAFAALVFAVWIFLADNRGGWLPYDFWPVA